MRKIECIKDLFWMNSPATNEKWFTKGKTYNAQVNQNGDWIAIDNTGIPHTIF